MDYPNRNIFLDKNEQHNIRKMLGPAKTISEYLGKAAEYLKEGKDLAQSLLESAPWIKDVAEGVGSAVPIVNVAVKLAEKWLEQTSPYELGAVACTLAYQQATEKAIKKVWTSAIGHKEAAKVDDRLAEQLRNLPPSEEVDLSTFSRDTSLQHLFVRRADRILGDLMRAVGFTDEMRQDVFNRVHDGFKEQLDLLLTDKKTADKFAPFREKLDLGNEELRVRAALQLHADYQRSQYLSDPLFKREPYALSHIYVNTECGKLNWKQINKERAEPFSENYGGRHDLIETVMSYITDEGFNEPIVIQGIAGAGKSSFTLRLSAELCDQGFLPIRIRLKRLRLTDHILDAINHAIELEDEERIGEIPFQAPEDLLLKGSVFNTYYGDNQRLSRYVLILDGWDELDMSDSKSFRDKVGEMLRAVRTYFIENRRSDFPRVRIIVTGRPSSDVTESRFLRDDTPVLTMRPMRPEQLKKFAADLDEAVGSRPIAVNQPEAWLVPNAFTLEEAFKRYEEAFLPTLPKYDKAGKITEEGQTPESGSLEVLGLPLLAYMAMRVMAEVVKSGGSLETQQAAITEMVNNPTLLYRRLTDLTCEKAGKAAFDHRDRNDEVEIQARIVGHKLRERLRRTAAAMSVLSVEHISRDEWLKRVPPDKDNKKTETAEGHPLAKLMISFYFKGGQPEQGCEFAHKSFREYLFAECIVETLKEFGRNLKKKESDKPPARNHWRDFSPTEDRPRYDFSRALSELLAPQWLKPEVLAHLRSLIEWEIERAKAASIAAAEKNAQSKGDSLLGLPTLLLSFDRWALVRDGLADLWEWWGDGAHLRPQVHQPAGDDPKVAPPYALKLALRAVPVTALKDETLELESTATLDAHLGDALCQLCAMAHFFIAVNDGCDWQKQAKLQNLKSGKSRKYQHIVKFGNIKLTLFAPSGRERDDALTSNFKRFIGRLNAAFDRPQGDFPASGFLSGVHLRANLSRANLIILNLSGANLSGAYLYDAHLSDANLSDANLSGANLSGTHLDGAILKGANLLGTHFLTLDQIKSAWIDEHTTLPKELEKMKPQILEWQRKRQEQTEIGEDVEEIEDEEVEFQEEDYAE